MKSGTLYVRERKLSTLIENFDFIDSIFHTWIEKKPNDNEKKMLNSVLVSFIGGWSIIPPVVFSARLAATTKAPMAQCLAAGFSASGPAHTSAIEKIMEIYLTTEIEDIEELVEEKLSKSEKIPGFGHPVLPKDPRPVVLRKLAEDNQIVGDAIRKYDKILDILTKKKQIFANIDGMAGAILVDLGFRDQSFGPAFFLMGRSLAMTAHIIEEYKNPAFSALNLVHPGFEKIEYRYRDSLEK